MALRSLLRIVCSMGWRWRVSAIELLSRFSLTSETTFGDIHPGRARAFGEAEALQFHHWHNVSWLLILLQLLE